MSKAYGFLGLLGYPKRDIVRAARELGYIRDVEIPGGGTVTLSAQLGDLNQIAKTGDVNPYTEIQKLCEKYREERSHHEAGERNPR